MKSTLPKAVRDLAQQFTRLPGVGPKTAQRMALYLLRQSPAVLHEFAQSMEELHARVRTCSVCFHLSEKELCVVCLDQGRDRSVVCVVEEALDVDAIERGDSYRGLYHVLGGVLSPMEGIGMDQLTITELLERVKSESVSELIIGLDHNMEAEATTQLIVRSVPEAVKVTRLARGLPTGGDIEFVDALTLNAAFEGRKRV